VNAKNGTVSYKIIKQQVKVVGKHMIMTNFIPVVDMHFAPEIKL
jgi:hypothetical protein